MVSLIVALAQNHAIGRDNQLLWHISEDLKYFKRTTTGHAVVMGRKTFESMGGKGLPNRTNLVISRTPRASESEQIHFFTSLSEALAAARTEDEEVFVIGGGEIYRQALEQDCVDRMYLTWVHTTISDADTFFPHFDPDNWKEASRTATQVDPKNGLEYAFVVYDRIR